MRQLGRCLLLTGTFVLLGCGRPSLLDGAARSAPHQTSRPKGQDTCTALPPLIPVAAAAVPVRAAPLGETWLSLSVPVETALEQVEMRVPTTLARGEDQSIGAAGEVTFTVRRGRPRLSVSGTRLLASLPIHIDLRVCKPLAGICLGYGSCSPEYEVTAALDLALDQQHQLPPLTLAARVVTGCTIGLDVTDHVTDVVKQQLGDVERTLERYRAALSPWIDRAISELSRPSHLDASRCVALTPEALLVSKPRLREHELRLSVGLRGTMVESDCDAKPRPARNLRVEITKLPREVSLALPEVFAWSQLEAAIRAGLNPSPAAETQLTLDEVRPNGAELMLKLTANGASCGQLWLGAQPKLQGGRLQLGEVRVLSGPVAPEVAQELTARVAGSLNVELHAEPWLRELALEERTEVLSLLLRESSGLEAEVTTPTVSAGAAWTTEVGVLVESRVDARLGLTVRKKGSH